MSVLTDADALERIRLRGVIASAQLKEHDATARAKRAEARVEVLETRLSRLREFVVAETLSREQFAQWEADQNGQVKS